MAGSCFGMVFSTRFEDVCRVLADQSRADRKQSRQSWSSKSVLKSPSYSTWSLLWWSPGMRFSPNVIRAQPPGGWGVIWLAPLVGAMLYVWLGINRIERRARSLRADRPRPGTYSGLCQCSAEILDQTLAPDGAHLKHLINLVRDVTQQPLLAGNRVVSLINGDQTYPAMLQAIEDASRSITLTTYIFRNDAMGQQFLEALKRAVARKVEVRVLIDDAGGTLQLATDATYPPASGDSLRPVPTDANSVEVSVLEPENHRKIMVVDGKTGFAGGINIDERNCFGRQSRHPIQDLHFRLMGPVVTQLQKVFVDDWAFSCGELLQGEPWFAPIAPDGAVLARGIPDGPDDDFETLRLTLLGAIACARSSVHVVTPYFLPDASLIAALNVAALRGVQVNLVLPAVNDLALVQWASTRTPAAGAGTGLPRLALATTVRSHQTAAGRRALDAPGSANWGPP